MNYLRLTVFAALVIPALGLTQTLSVVDAAYNLEADANSGTSHDSQSRFNNSVGPLQSYFDQVDAFASKSSSTVHSFASVAWNCSPTDLDVELVACWDSIDNGAGNSAHLLSQLWLDINVDVPNIVSTSAVFDQPNSWAEIDVWNGSSWALLVNRNQIQAYSGLWGPGDYRLRVERHYDPVGDSTVCVPGGINLHAQAVPEPASMLALSAGAALLLRRRKPNRVTVTPFFGGAAMRRAFWV